MNKLSLVRHSSGGIVNRKLKIVNRKSSILLFVLLTSNFCTPAFAGSIVGWGVQIVGVNLDNGFIAVSAGGDHSLGLKQDGSIVAWGRNDAYGQCNIPLPNSGFVTISAGYNHSLGLKPDGSIIAWGENHSGQCKVPSPNTGFVAIAAGAGHSLGLKQDGSIVAWGHNNYGQCDIPSPNIGFVAIAAGGSHSLGLKSDGSIVAWGYNYFGQLGNGQSGAGEIETTPVYVLAGEQGEGELKDIVAISAGNYHVLALDKDRKVWAWGKNEFGQLGDGSTADKDTPGQVIKPDNSPLTDIIYIDAGFEHSLAIDKDGTVWVWGRNQYYELGLGDDDNRFYATPVPQFKAK